MDSLYAATCIARLVFIASVCLVVLAGSPRVERIQNPVLVPGPRLSPG